MTVTFLAAARSRAATRSPRSIHPEVPRSTRHACLEVRAGLSAAGHATLSLPGQRVHCQRVATTRGEAGLFTGGVLRQFAFPPLALLTAS